ncbi:hypothetical protein ACIHFC_32960 [Streptomyces sp. NPDC052013]|uniref:hypothetical protein n=1 Tax=Streptomyces sp. NPDC052013 TaxID=3365679 RepID=UPI0037CD4C2F
MTDTLHTPPHTAGAHHQRPFTRDPGRWDKESSRALHTGHVRDSPCSAACQPVLVHERTSWGWLTWTVPGDGTLPEVPQQIAVLIPDATLAQRLTLRWLTRNPARRIALHTVPGSLRFSTAAFALISLVVGLLAMRHGVPVDVALPAMLLAPLLTEHLLDRLDARASEHVRTVEGDDAVRYLQRLATLHTHLVQSAADCDRHELRRTAELGHSLLWDAVGLLQNHDTRSASVSLIGRERLMLQLVSQVTQIVELAAAEDDAADADQTWERGRPLGRTCRAPLRRHPAPRPAHHR